ncbi:MAG: hypothetical protein HY335_08645 [Deinococcus sp.]|nr:hypothetical protein [Deinococcus sp.]
MSASARPVSLGPLQLAHPLVLAAGPLSGDAASIRAAFDAGFAAVVTRTVSRHPHSGSSQVISQQAETMTYRGRWVSPRVTPWLRSLAPLQERPGPLLISIGPTIEDVIAVAEEAAEFGCDALELVSETPDDLVAMVQEARRRVDLPLFAKLGGHWAHWSAVAGRCLHAGATGITVTDAIPQGADSYQAGAALKPVALAAVASIARAHQAPIIGVGGVASAQDVIDLLQAGASAVGLCTAPLLHGLGVVQAILAELAQRSGARV